MRESLHSQSACLRCYPSGGFDVYGMKCLVSVLDIKTDRIDHSVSAGKRARDRLFVVNIGFDRLNLRIVTSKRLSLRSGCLDAIRTENPRLRRWRTMRRPRNPVPPNTVTVRAFAMAQIRQLMSQTPRQVTWTGWLPTSVHDEGDLIEMGINLVR